MIINYSIYSICDHLDEFIFKDSCDTGCMYCKKCKSNVPTPYVVELILRRLKNENS